MGAVTRGGFFIAWQVRDQEYALNLFKLLAIDYVNGSVLDLGCGLGNLSLEAGRRGHRVLAVDASPTAAARLNKDSQREGLPVRGIQADIENWTIDQSYDTIVVIGLLMFFRHETAFKLHPRTRQTGRSGYRQRAD